MKSRFGADIETEWKLVREMEAGDRMVAVNLFNLHGRYKAAPHASVADDRRPQLPSHLRGF